MLPGGAPRTPGAYSRGDFIAPAPPGCSEQEAGPAVRRGGVIRAGKTMPPTPTSSHLRSLHRAPSFPCAPPGRAASPGRGGAGAAPARDETVPGGSQRGAPHPRRARSAAGGRRCRWVALWLHRWERGCPGSLVWGGKGVFFYFFIFFEAGHKGKGTLGREHPPALCCGM